MLYGKTGRLPGVSLGLLLLLASPPVRAQEMLWEQTGDTDLPASARNSALYVHPNGDLFVGTNDGLGCEVYCGSEGSVYRSLDGGQSWERTAFEGEGVTTFAAYPNGDVLLATLGGVFRSGNRGQTWAAVSTTGVGDWIRAAYVTSEGVIYLGLGGVPGMPSGGLFRSSDAAQTWEEQTLDGESTDPIEVTGILQAEDGTLLAGTHEGVFQAIPQGEWVQTVLAGVRVDHLTGSPEGVLYAATAGGTLHRSVNAGLSWGSLFVPSTQILGLAAGSRGRLFVSGAEGLYGSKTSGASWERLGDGIGALVIASDAHLVTAAAGGGLFRSVSVVELAGAPDGPAGPDGPALDPNYPDPFTGATTIPFTLARPGFVTLEVFDLLGRRVARPVDGFYPAGRHDVAFEAGALAGGVYLYRLHTGTTRQTRRMTLIR